MFDTIAKVIYAYQTNKNYYCNQEEFNFVKNIMVKNVKKMS